MANNALPLIAAGAAALILLGGKKKSASKKSQHPELDPGEPPLISAESTPQPRVRGATRIRLKVK